MLRNNLLWVFVLAETGLSEKEGSTSREKWIPELLLQFLNLSFEICNQSCLLLKSSNLDQGYQQKEISPWTLEELDACMLAVENNFYQTRDTRCDTRFSYHSINERISSQSKRMAEEDKFRWEPAPNPESIVIPGLNTAAPTADQIEQIDQLITLKLQVSFVGACIAAADDVYL